MQKKLSPRETQITDLVKQGKRYRVIADMLGISISCVSIHMVNAREKYQVSSNVELFLKLAELMETP
jgi:DNA-binding CsgD family transcriptional regulator